MTNILNITGPLNFDTVPVLSRDTHRRMEGAQAVRVDCSGVTQCNSAALALFVELIQRAEKQGIQLEFSGIPVRLMKISAACGIRGLFEGNK